MRRAICLIIVLTALGVGCGLWADSAQRGKAREYLGGIEVMREALLNDDMDGAAREQAYWHALWQHDEKRLNYILSHELTRDAAGALMKLSTALAEGGRFEALQALDEVEDAFMRMESGDSPTLENIL